MTRSPDTQLRAFALYGDGGTVVAASESYAAVAAALGCEPDSAPPWMPEVLARLTDGMASVSRRDRPADGEGVVESEHERVSGADGAAMIASRYALVDGSAQAPPSGPAAQRLDDLLRLSGEWLYETDAALVLTYVSDRVFDDLAALPAELVGQRLPEIGVFDSGPSVFADQLDPDRRRPFADRMADVRHASGKLRRIRFSGVPVFDAGAFVGYRGVARDETRQQTARDAALRAEARLKVGLAASRDGFAIFDGDGLLVCANPQVAIDLGRHGPLPAGIEFGKLLNHALKTGWFVDTDAPTLASTRPRLSNPTDGQAMIEIALADGRRVLFCASRTECGDVLLISTDITAFSAARRPKRSALRRTA